MTTTTDAGTAKPGLVVRNNWGRLVYSWRGEAVKLPARALVHWPDGAMVWHPLQWQPHWESVSDMGRQSSVRTARLVVAASYHGHRVHIQATELQLLAIEPSHD